ncbi:MAG: tetraacyldisaccharide 4'-kinase [Desulfobacula sp.]|nr:tetraacyldisaccharide 4'-kinase [Desulfobacula sp.]MDA8133785.1 tetraacyldisaccharide 4'-kinase [Desulfobacteraceae bacterium]
MFKERLDRIKDRITQISGQDYTPVPLSLEWALVVLSRLYGLGVGFRLWLYQKKILRQGALPCFVVSIGNIVAGGTGKTPMTLYTAELLKKIGKKPVVVSRGYGGSYKEDSLVVFDGGHVFSSPDECGDEPFMMAARRLCPVVVGKDRLRAGMRALDSLEPRPEAVVLDDGFQHIRLKRDLDILLFDFNRPLGNTRLLPAGRLRERPQSSGKRADALVFTRCPEENASRTQMEAVLRFYPDRPFFKTVHQPYILRWIKKEKKSPDPGSDLAALKGRTAVLFSGLADNRAFYASMAEHGINILYHLEFNDHHRYKTADFLTINRMAVEKKADLILTTEKDGVKIDKTIEWAADVLVIGIRIRFEDPEKFEDFLVSKMEKK